MKKALFLFLSLISLAPHGMQAKNDRNTHAIGATIGILIAAAATATYAGYRYYYSSQDNTQPQEQRLPQLPHHPNQGLFKALQEDDNHVQGIFYTIPPKQDSDQPKPQETQDNSITQKQQENFEGFPKALSEEKRKTRLAIHLKNRKNTRNERAIQTIVEYQIESY